MGDIYSMSLNHKANKDEVALEFELTRRAEQARLQAIYDKIESDNKMYAYTQRLLGELMGLLVSQKLITKGQCFMLTNYVKSQIFNQEELALLEKINAKQFQPEKK